MTEIPVCFLTAVFAFVCNLLRTLEWHIPTWLTWLSLILFLAAVSYLYLKQLALWLKDGPVRPSGPRFLFGFLLVAALSAAAFLVDAESLPHLGMGDELRDVPIHAQNFLTGLETDPFRNGNYNGFSLIGATLGIPGEIFFPHSVASNRITAALISLFGVLLFYAVASHQFSLPVAVSGAISLALLPLTLWNARGDVVVVENMLYLPFIILWIKRGFQDHSVQNLRVGFVLGSALHFQLAIAVASGLVLAILPLTNLLRFIRTAELYRWIRSTSLLAFGVVIAISPRATYLPDYIASAAQRISLDKPTPGTPDYLVYYIRTLNGFVRPVLANHFAPPYPIPIAPYYLTLLALLCLPLAAFTRPWSQWQGELRIAACILLVCLTHSAATNSPLLPHRLIIIGPFVTYLAISALSLVEEKIGKYRGAALSLVIIFLIPAIAETAHFFAKIREADETAARLGDRSHACMALARLLPAYPRARNATCLMTDDSSAAYSLNLVHIRELLQYFSGMPRKYRIQSWGHSSYQPRVIVLSTECVDFEQWEKRREQAAFMGKWSTFDFYLLP